MKHLQEKSSNDGYIKLLMGCARSSIQDLENFLRIVIGLDEDDIQLISGHYIPYFFTSERNILNCFGGAFRKLRFHEKSF